MPNIETATCWMCGAPADSREHIFKASELKRIFQEDGYSPESLPFHFSEKGHARIPGPKSSLVKYPNIICGRCNNDRTSAFDRAYDRLSDWLASRQSNYGIAEIDLLDVFGSTYIERIGDLRRFFAKNLGCRIVASGAILANNFPNPIYRNNHDLFQVSICRSQPFRDLQTANPTIKYEPGPFERTLGKGDLFVHLSKSLLEEKGIKLVKSAIWWENVGHFQVNYWFNIDIDFSLGDPLDSTNRVYGIKHTDLGLSGMKEAMWRWLETHQSH
jgi:hypothetical protein